MGSVGEGRGELEVEDALVAARRAESVREAKRDGDGTSAALPRRGQSDVEGLGGVIDDADFGVADGARGAARAELDERGRDELEGTERGAAGLEAGEAIAITGQLGVVARESAAVGA
jgi:hypothetical protein